MNYCTQCGRKLPPSGECPACASRYIGHKSKPIVQTVEAASCSYTTLALACVWSLSLLCTLVFAALVASPLLLMALPGIPVVVGLWMVFVGVGHTQRLGYGFVITGLQLMGIVTAVALAALGLMCFEAIFLCTSALDYGEISGPLLLLALVLLLSLPLVTVFLYKIRRVALTSRSVLLHSRSTVEVPLLAILLFLLATPALAWASVRLTAADRFLATVVPMVKEMLPAPYPALFSLLTGSWSGMLLPLLLLALSCLYTAIVLIRYRVRLFLLKRRLARAEAAETAKDKA